MEDSEFAPVLAAASAAVGVVVVELLMMMTIDYKGGVDVDGRAQLVCWRRWIV